MYIDVSSTGYVTSPNYPEPYTEGAYTNLIITASVGDYLVLWFEDIDLPPPSSDPPGLLLRVRDTMDSCTDYVQITEVDSQGNEYGLNKICGPLENFFDDTYSRSISTGYGYKMSN